MDSEDRNRGSFRKKIKIYWPDIKEVLSVFKDFASLIISAAALVVASNSFRTSERSFDAMVSFQKFDRDQRNRAYLRDEDAREQAIQPKLNYNLIVGSVAFSIHNLGLGPAIIKDYQFYANNKYANGSDPVSFTEYAKVLGGIFGLNENDLKIDESSRFELRAHRFGTDAILDKGQERTLLAIDYENYNEVYNKASLSKKELLNARRRKIEESFDSNFSRVGFMICYCSLTEKKCMTMSSHEDKNFESSCKSKEKRSNG